MPQYQFFEELKARGVTTVEVIGVASDYCVRHAIEGFLKRGFIVHTSNRLTHGIERDVKAVLNRLFLLSHSLGCFRTPHHPFGDNAQIPQGIGTPCNSS
jgi:hypothetical protein